MSSGPPSASTAPRCMTITQSHSVNTSSMSCSMMTKSVRRAAASDRMRSSTWSRSRGLTPDVGSSRKHRRGSLASATAKSSRRCWPCDSWSARRWRSSHRPTSESTCSTFAATSGPERRRNRRLCPRRVRQAISTFWNTVSRANTSTTWKVRLICRRTRSWDGRFVMSPPSNRMLPASGTRWPVRRCTSVVLPAPLGPMMPVIRPDTMSRSTLSTAVIPPKALRRPRASRSVLLTAYPFPVRPAEDGAEHAAAEAEYQRDDDQPHEQHPVVGDADDDLLYADEQHRADDRPGEHVDAPQERGEDWLRRVEPVGIDRRNGALERRQHGTGETRIEPGDHERPEPEPANRDADESGADGAVAYRLECQPQRRVDDAVHQPDRKRRHYQDEIVVVRKVAEIDRDDVEVERRPGNAGQAVVAAGHRAPPGDDGEDHHAEAEGQHGEIDLGEPHRQVAEDKGADAGRQHPAHDTERQRRHLEQDQRRHIGAEREEPGLAEREEAGIAEQQVEAEREHRQQHHLHQQVDAEVAGPDGREHQRDDQDREDRADE